MPSINVNPVPKKTDRIAIIGAGPAGLHMGLKLRERGFENLTLFDKEDRIGGMTDTREKDGLPHELGVCYLHIGYTEIKRLVQLTNATREVKPGGPGETRDIYTEFLPSSPNELNKWIFAEIERLTVPKWLQFLPNSLQKLSFGRAMRLYISLHKQIFGNYKYGIPPKPNPDLWKRIDKNFEQFLKDEGVFALEPFFRLTTTAMGYGFLSAIPAYYGLLWNTPVFMEGFLNNAYQDSTHPVLTVLRDGFGTLWGAVARYAEASAHTDKAYWNIKLGYSIEKVDRSGEFIRLEGTRKAGETWQEEFDWLIVAGGLQSSLRYLDSSAEEHQLFVDMQSACLVTHLFEVDEVNDAYPVCISSWPDELRAGYNGGVYSIRDTRRTLLPDTATQKSRRLIVTYQYFDHALEEEPEKVTQYALDDLKAKGLRNPVVCLDQATGQPIVRVWNQYFSRFSQKRLNEGAPWKLLNMQGEKRTWFIGGDACFESMHDISQYNLMLLDQHLGPE